MFFLKFLGTQLHSLYYISTETDFLGRVKAQYQVLIVYIVDNNNVSQINYDTPCTKDHNESSTQNSE